jgi:hypothetical protein
MTVFTIPPNNKVAGQTGFIPDIDNTYFTLATLATGNVLNTAYAGGADNTGVTNAQPAIQAAITAVGTGGIIYLPAGTYLLSSPLSITTTVNIIGAGRNLTTLQLANGVNDYAIKFTQSSGAITGAHFSDFSINGNALNQTAGGGISGVGAVECQFERVWFTSCWGWGLALQAIPAGGGFGHHNRISYCSFDGAQNIGYGGGGWATSSDENYWNACDFQYLGGSTAPASASFPVMLYDQAGLQHVENCVFVGSRGSGSVQVTGFQSQSANQSKVIGCTFDGVGGDNIYIAGTDAVIVGNTCTSVGDQCPNAGASAGIHLQFGALRCTVTGNNISSSSTNGRTGWLIYEQQIGSSGSNTIRGNTLHTVGTLGTAALVTAGVASLVSGNIGYNPVGSLGPPTVPGSTTVLVNPYNVNASVFVTGGTVTVIAVNGVTTGQITGQFTVPAGGSIKLTYSVAPTWVWIGW